MKFPSPWRIPAATAATSAFLILACNLPFWKAFIAATGGFRAAGIPLYASTFLVLALVLNVLLTLLAFRALVKPLLGGLIIASAFAAYFMGRFGVAIDPAMMQNVFETDVRETAELVSWRLLLTVGMLGVLPCLLLWRVRFDAQPFWRDLAVRAGVAALCLLAAGGLLIGQYKTFAPTFREHGEFRYLVAPFNYLYATARYLEKKRAVTVAAPLGTDAVKGPAWIGRERRTVAIIVVGETARAMNFSLNGYARPTNPELAAEPGLINFSNVSSCGTATAVSLPCAFSVLGRRNYSDSKAKSQQGLLDVLSHAGFEVLWRDNNSGCKGVCDRVRSQDVSRPVPGDALCGAEECYDERLLENLADAIRASTADMVIVLHQKGSHGPAYWKRYPPAFEKWRPVCRTANLNECPVESIVAAYDNTILYTDHVLAASIDLLRRLGEHDRIDTALLYFSDHGESLGEGNMYLHGTPYLFAPAEQRRVPMMAWLSESYLARFSIDGKCLAARADQPFSHDNVFHSVLGMLNVSTAVYNPSLDIFHACRRIARPRVAALANVLRGMTPTAAASLPRSRPGPRARRASPG